MSTILISNQDTFIDGASMESGEFSRRLLRACTLPVASPILPRHCISYCSTREETDSRHSEWHRWVLEIPPGPRQVSVFNGTRDDWHGQDEDSYETRAARVRIGSSERILSFPYIIMGFAIDASGRRGEPLSYAAMSGAFLGFRNAPIKSIADEILRCPLPNSDGHYCSGLEDWDLNDDMSIHDIPDQFVAAFFNRGFNPDLDVGSAGALNTSVGSVEAWEAETKRDPMYGLRVSWPQLHVSRKSLEYVAKVYTPTPGDYTTYAIDMPFLNRHPTRQVSNALEPKEFPRRKSATSVLFNRVTR